VSTGTALFVNFEPTSPELIVEEMTTRSLPFASALVDAAADFTVTEYPSVSSLFLAAASPVFSVVDPTTKSAGGESS